MSRLLLKLLETMTNDCQEELPSTLCCEFYNDSSGYLGVDDRVSCISSLMGETGAKIHLVLHIPVSWMEGPLDYSGLISGPS